MAERALSEPIMDEDMANLYKAHEQDPYVLHKLFVNDLIALAEKYDDLDHHLSLGSDLQHYCLLALQLAESVPIPEPTAGPDQQPTP